MAKKQTRRSISVSGDTYNDVRDYCDKHKLSASGHVTDLLAKYLKDHALGPPPTLEKSFNGPNGDESKEPLSESSAPPSSVPARISPPQAAGDVRYPDRRGPGFSPLPEGGKFLTWLVTAHIEIVRKRRIDAQASVETLLDNLVHRRMVNGTHITKIDRSTES